MLPKTSRKTLLQVISDAVPGKMLLAIIATISLLFLTLPIVALIIRCIQTQAWEEMAGSSLVPAVILSFLTILISIIVTISFGTPLAYVLARRQFRGKRFISVLVELPVVLPPAVAGLGLLVAFGRRGLFGPALGAIDISLPFTTAAVIL